MNCHPPKISEDSFVYLYSTIVQGCYNYFRTKLPKTEDSYLKTGDNTYHTLFRQDDRKKDKLVQYFGVDRAAENLVVQMLEGEENWRMINFIK